MRVQLQGVFSARFDGLYKGDHYSGIAFYIKDGKPVSYNPKQYERLGPSYGSGSFAAWRQQYEASKLQNLYSRCEDGVTYGCHWGRLLLGEVFSREWNPTWGYEKDVNWISHRGDLIECMYTSTDYLGNIYCHYTIYEIYMKSPTKPAVREIDYYKYYRYEQSARDWTKDYLLSHKEDVLKGTKTINDDYFDLSTKEWPIQDVPLPDPLGVTISKPQVIPEFYNNWELVKEYNWVDWNFERALSTAKINAIDTMPTINMGFLGNLMELTSVIKTLMEVRKGKVSLKSFKSVRDAVSSIWLTKRYSVNTTKSDIEEYKELFSRLVNLCQTDLARFHGKYVEDGLSFSVSFSLDTDKIVPSNIKEVLSAFGAKPSLQDLWDIIPYSFIVDWFLGIGDLLQFGQNYKLSLTLPVKDLWVSISSTEKDWYMRFQPESLPALPYLVHKSTSMGTWLMRLTDVFALIL